MIDLQERAQFIDVKLHEASDIAMGFYGNITGEEVKTGDNNQVLTDADKAIGALLVE